MPALEGKRAWLTGASSGIGEETARLFAAEGSEVVLSARRLDRLQKLGNDIEELGGKVLLKPLDVTDREAVVGVGRELEAAGGVDILVNAAGIMPLSPMLEGRVEEWDRTIDINVKGLLYATNAVLRNMASRKSGHIVNISSVAGRVTFPGGAVYCASKFAVRVISDALRKEALHFGVRVTDIQPGAVQTELTESIGHEETRRTVTGTGGFYDPARQILTAADIAAAILYAVTQPDHVNVCEILVRPKSQEV